MAYFSPASAIAMTEKRIKHDVSLKLIEGGNIGLVSYDEKLLVREQRLYALEQRHLLRWNTAPIENKAGW